MFKELKKLLIYLLMLPLYWLSYLIPKNETLWIFGAWCGLGKGDNSEAFFNYVKQYHPEIKAVWLTKNKLVYQYFKKKNCSVYYTNSVQGLYFTMRAKIGIINCYKFDINRYVLNRTKLIQLWHGIPLKKIEHDSELLKKNQNQGLLASVKNIIFPFLKEKYHYVISTSKESAKNFATAFQISPEQVLITGYPRNDILLNNSKIEFPFLKTFNQKHIILYAPTFRDSNFASLEIFETFNAQKMNDFLLFKDALLVIKAHHLTEEYFQNLSQTGSQIHITNSEEIPDVNSFLPHVDILITDYSSIFFDFLLLDRPIIFAPFDLQTYISHDRELYYEYDEVTPGPKAKNWDDVINYLDKFFENPKLFAQQRNIIRKRFHEYCDSKSSERLFNKILEILGDRINT